MSSERDLDERLTALYAVPLETFVAERKRLADEMKRAGDREGAAALAKAAKPPVSAWVVNQLARRESDGVERLARASAKVREAQLEMVGGKGGGAGGAGGREAFAEATAAQREGLAALRAAAEKILEEGGHATTPAVLERVARSLRAMVASEEAARQIAAGCLVDDVVAGEGLGDFAALAASLPAGPPRARGHQPAAPARSDKADRSEKAGKAEEAATRAEEKAAEKAERQRQQQAAATRADLLARLRRLIEEAEARARTAAKTAERARRAADAAEAEAKQAEAAAARAEAEAEAARRALDKA